MVPKLVIVLLLLSSCKGSQAFVGGGMLFRDGSYLTQGGDKSSYRGPEFGQESFDDEPFLFAGLSFPIGPTYQQPVMLQFPVALQQSAQASHTSEPTSGGGGSGSVTVPGVGEVDLVVPEGDPWMVVALSVLVLACGITAFLWWRRKRKAQTA